MPSVSNPIQELDTALSRAITKRLLDVHTSMPGIVQSYDATNQTAEVTIAMKRLKVDGTEIDALKLPNVRVIFPKCNQGSITWPLAKGDEVLLVFNERDIDSWRGTGSIGKPGTNRRFTLTDVCCIPGYSSDKNLVEHDSGDDTALVVRFKTTKLVLSSDGKVKAGKVGSTQTEPLVLGNVMKSGFDALIAQSKAIATSVKTGPVGVGNLGQAVPTHPTLITALTAIEGQMDTIKSTYVDTASTNIVSQIAFTERGA